jgi:hypothetical protein
VTTPKMTQIKPTGTMTRSGALRLAAASAALPPGPIRTGRAAGRVVEPPASAIYSDPIRPFHNATPHIAAMPAPPEIAVQIYNRGTMPTMLAKPKSGQSIDQVIARANDELEGFAR